MVIENLAQRGADFKEEVENIRTVEKYLNGNKDKLFDLRESRKSDHPNSRLIGSNRQDLKQVTAGDVKVWL